jgi:hypothetical protein
MVTYICVITVNRQLGKQTQLYQLDLSDPPQVPNQPCETTSLLCCEAPLVALAKLTLILFNKNLETIIGTVIACVCLVVSQKSFGCFQSSIGHEIDSYGSKWGFQTLIPRMTC